MEGTSRPQTISTKLQGIAEQAARYPDMVFTTLMHHVNIAFLFEAYLLTKKNRAPGLSGITAMEYEKDLRENLSKVHQRLKEGTYHAPHLKRVWIEKDEKSKRPIALPEFEDKILQRAIVMILEAIYEKDFYDVSYGFRKGRSCHQALFELREQCMNNNIGWVVDADIRGFYDSIDHQKLKTVIKQRVNDGAMIKLIGKWLKAGILEEGSLSYPELGTVQGGVISPIISNIYLHHVLDDWFMKTVKPRLKGKSFLVRFADDFVIGCELEEDARKVMNVLPKRFEKYGLTIHPEKTKLIEFKRPSKSKRTDKKNGTFDFLGFTHYWGLSLKGNWAIKRKTARKRQKRTLKRIWQWCKENRHEQLEEQHRMLCAKLRGHYNYYGLRCNIESLMRVYRHLVKTWRYWLKKRSQRNLLTLKKFDKILERYSLPTPRIVHNF